VSRSVSIWRQNGLHVNVSLNDDGTLQISGQDLETFGDDEYEYEYALTVAPDDVAKITAALGGAPGDDVIALLCDDAEDIINIGELTWLRSIGVERAFWSRLG
jgi:hypothetical protein